MSSTIEELQCLISREMVRVRSSFRASPQYGIDARVALLECSRALDHFFVRPLLTRQPNPASLWNLYAAGSHRAFTLFLDETADRGGVPLTPSVPHLHNWADSAIQHLGRVAQSQHLLELSKATLATLSRINNGRFCVTFPDALVDSEAFDVSDQLWLRRLASRIDEPLQKELADRLPSIISKMRALVYLWREHYVGYDTTPDIDEHFLNAGVAWARTLGGQSELPGDLTVGGHPFYAYRAVIGLMCGRALKHLSFASELAQQRPELERRNFWAIWSTIDEWCAFFQEALDIDRGTARQLLHSLTLDREYQTAFGSSAPGALPPLIKVSKNQLVMSLTGCLDAPFWFVLGKLRHCYRNDWDSIVDSRESMFRDELLELFGRAGIRTIARPVRIREQGRIVTDIDAVAFDAKSGRLLLCQLKWQDPFGRSMRSRRNKMTNLITTANRWIDVVHGWSHGMARDQLAKVLGFGDCTIQRIELLVLARHHSRFTKGIEPDSRAAWGTWGQVCRIVTEDYRGGELIDTLMRQLTTEADRVDSPRAIPVGALRVSDQLTLEIRRAGSS